MSFKQSIFLIIALFVTCSSNATHQGAEHLADSSSVWSVSNGENTLYLGGTIHLLSKSDYPLPKNFDIAYENSSTVIFETDIGAMESLEMQQVMLAKMLLPKGMSLKQTISLETYEELDSYLTSVGQSIDQYAHFRASMVALILTVNEIKRLGMGEAGVDSFYHQKASQDNKEVGWLESVESHVDYLASMGDGYEDDYLIYTLNDIQKIKPMLLELKTAWRNGDLEADRKLLKELMEVYPSVYQSLLVERNNHWIPQIESMLESQDIEFVLVGKLHLGGKDGLIKKLEDKGYRIEVVK